MKRYVIKMKKSYLPLYIVPIFLGLSLFTWAFVTQDRNIDYWWYFAWWAFGFLLVSLVVLKLKLFVTYGAWVICGCSGMHTIVFGDRGWYDLQIAASIPFYLVVIFCIGIIETSIKVFINKYFEK